MVHDGLKVSTRAKQERTICEVEKSRSSWLEIHIPKAEISSKFQTCFPIVLTPITLGDVIGETAAAFELSYIENCLTSNPTLGVLHSRSRNDIYAIVKMAGDDEPQGEALEGSYSVEEINELVTVMKKLLIVRDVLLKVNQQYIASAAQSDGLSNRTAVQVARFIP